MNRKYLYQPIFMSMHDSNLPSTKVFESQDEARKWGRGQVENLRKEHDTQNWGMAMAKIELIS